MLSEGLEDVEVEVDAELAGNGEHDGVCGMKRLILGQLLDEDVGLSGVGAPEGRLQAVDDADLVAGVLTAQGEEPAIDVGDDREDRSRDTHARGPVVAGLLPGLTVAADLLGLEVGEALPSGLGQEG